VKKMADKNKVMLMGLDNAGKSSIVMSMKGHTNLMEFRSLEPTRKIDINEIVQEDGKYVLWDFGGQKHYRDEYLNELKSGKRDYFADAKDLIYVIDVRDRKRYDAALDYFKSIMDLVEEKKNDNNLNITVYLHKFDPGVEQINDFKKDNLDEKLVSKIHELIPPNYPKKIQKTSIYTVFSKFDYK
jgi:GTPase SAR1 family protein